MGLYGTYRCYQDWIGAAGSEGLGGKCGAVGKKRAFVIETNYYLHTTNDADI